MPVVTVTPPRAPRGKEKPPVLMLDKAADTRAIGLKRIRPLHFEPALAALAHEWQLTLVLAARSIGLT